MKLVIVESPTKAKTLQKFLGEDFKLVSSYGHIRDLPKSKLGIDTENNFEPTYTIPKKSKKVIKKLKKKAKKADSVILATDEDREGEAIAFHLKKVLDLKDPKRIVFHEITEKAIKEALKNPRNIKIDLVNSQKARRVLDRLVGYKLSPFLWKKVARGLSAGRVQSVALKFIAEREKEREEFTPKEYWTIKGIFQNKEEFEAKLRKKGKEKLKKFSIQKEEKAKEIVEAIKENNFKVKSIKKKEKKKNPYPPFVTSTLQSSAGNKLNFSAKKTMILAQQLYEKGFITYHRTDSVNLSNSSQKAAKKLIKEKYGKKYWPGFERNFKTKSKSAQEAHEAIRPTQPQKTPKKAKKKLKPSAFKLYRLIWQRFIASQMKEAKVYSTKMDIKGGKFIFRANGQILKFKGFLKVYPVKFSENQLPSLEKGEKLNLEEVKPKQHFTRPPARYTEAKLVKVLKKEGIGRPSTYATILDTIQKRNYVRKNKKKRLKPTEIGTLVNNILTEHFSNVINKEFTAEMEQNLDKVAEGDIEKEKVIKDFYNPFIKRLEKKEEEVSKDDIREELDEKCPKCGAPLVTRWSKYGKFYSCKNYPECKYKKSPPKPKLDIPCPKCEKGEIVEKRTKKGKVFYACNQWPDCKFALWDKPTGEKCPECGSLLVEKRKKLKCSNDDCDFEKKKS